MKSRHHVVVGICPYVVIMPSLSVVTVSLPVLEPCP